MNITEKLFALSDAEYRSFQSRLMPNIDPSLVIGVRTPMLRSLAREFYATDEGKAFMSASSLPHKYYEENNLHAFMIDFIRDYDECIAAINAFLPYVDNWATCDQMKARALTKDCKRTLENAKIWMKSEHTYTKRFGIEVMMNHFLDERFEKNMPLLVADAENEEYYVKMMIAWYYATALAKHYDDILPYLEKRTLSVWTHNKAIQKATESRRLSEEQKNYLRSLKV